VKRRAIWRLYKDGKATRRGHWTDLGAALDASIAEEADEIEQTLTVTCVEVTRMTIQLARAQAGRRPDTGEPGGPRRRKPAPERAKERG
jgi:hypothetical protein